MTPALKIAAREVRSATGRFAFVVVAVGLGVGALTGVRSFSQAFRAMLLDQARTLMAGDISLRVAATPTPAQTAALAALARQGVRWTRITESVSMVAAPRSGPVGTGPRTAAGVALASPILTTLKAVDPRAYPFAGAVDTTPPGALAALDDASVLVSPDLLLRAGLRAGDTLSVGGQPFRIAGLDLSEPDRLAGGLSIGPRLLMTAAGLRRTGIIQFGSQVQSRLLFQLRPGAPPLAAVEARLRAAFPGARLQDYRDANPTVERGLDHSTTFLSLISLMALVVGALGVASAMHAHLQLRLDAIATMKVLGARTAQILGIYGLQTLLLGLAGGVVGIALSAGVERVFPHLLAQFFPNMPALGWSWGPAAEGLAAGVLITLLFTVPTLLGVRRIPPAAILRRHMDDGGLSRPRRARRALESGLTGLVLLAGVAALAVSLTDEPLRQSLRIGGYFLAALALGIGTLAAVAWALLRLMRLAGHARRLPVALRHGLANLYRPGSQAQPVLVALGIGVMFTLSIFLLQRALLADLQRGTPQGVANVFLIDIPLQQADAVLALLDRQPGLENAPEILRTVAARLETINGAAPAPAARNVDRGGRGGRGNEDGGRGAFRRRQYSLASFAAMPGGVTLAQGRWWNHPAVGHPEIAVSQDFAAAYRLHLGDRLGWSAGDTRFQAPITAIYEPAPQRVVGSVEVMVSPGPLAGLPENINGGVRVQPASIPGLESALFDRFPTVTVVNLADVIERVQQVVDQITLVVHFVSFFAVLAGAIILASSVAGTRFRRMREIAILKAFGGTRGRIAAIFSTEFLVLGAAAGLAGGLLAVAFTNLIAHRLLTVPFQVDFVPSLIAVAATAAIAVAAGWLACARILGLKPLEVLRGE